MRLNVDTQTAPQQTAAMTELRRRFFAQAGNSASHFGVSFERMVQHLWDARRQRAPLPIRRIGNVDDLVHVVACIGDSERAWRELTELYESWLVRRLRREVGASTAVLVVRQTLVELRRFDACDGACGSLHDYLGIQPLRDWLTGRVFQHMAHRAVNLQQPAALTYVHARV